MKKLFGLVVMLTAAVGAAWLWQLRPLAAPAWTPAEIETINSLWLGNLPPVPAAPSNAVADDVRAARFGQALFFDPRLSANGGISCSTCHQPIRQFTDGLQKGVAIGMSNRNTPSIVGSAYSPWLYWDGRKDSLWSQALAPLEDPAEHGSNRMQLVHLIADDPIYRNDYESIFGPLADFSDRMRFPEAGAPGDDPVLDGAWLSMSADDRDSVNRVFANIGKAIAAYERLLQHGPSRFDTYAAAVTEGDTARQAELFDTEEAHGLRLFIGEARCTECHNGPLFSNAEFHNTGILAFPGDLPDRGRSDGLRLALADPFNCLGDYSDDPEPYCAELRFARTGIELIGAVKTPSLRNLQNTGPFMHRGQLATLAETLDHYNRAPLAMIGHNEAEVPLGLNGRELRQLEAFLHTLAAPLATPPEWLSAPDGSLDMSKNGESINETR